MNDHDDYDDYDDDDISMIGDDTPPRHTWIDGLPVTHTIFLPQVNIEIMTRIDH